MNSFKLHFFNIVYLPELNFCYRNHFRKYSQFTQFMIHVLNIVVGRCDVKTRLVMPVDHVIHLQAPQELLQSFLQFTSPCINIPNVSECCSNVRVILILSVNRLNSLMPFHASQMSYPAHTVVHKRSQDYRATIQCQKEVVILGCHVLSKIVPLPYPWHLPLFCICQTQNPSLSCSCSGTIS